MKMIWLGLLLVGCVSTEHVMTPDGQDGMALTCRRIADCYSEASYRCPSGYKVLDKTVERKTTVLITCKASPQASPALSTSQGPQG